MINYYRILGVKSSASNSDIKSAYRKLARQRHPDVSESPTAARDFDLISKAYHVLSDPQERAYYDEQLNAQNTSGYSILQSNNPHARRARNLAVQAKWDRVVDEVLERDRMENRERQRVVFTTVSLFLSTFFVALIRPPLWQIFDYAGRAVVLTLFVIGIWHLATRLREYFAHYTYIPKPFTYTIMREDEKPEQPFTRFSAYTFLLVGYALSVGVGLFISWQTQDFFTDISSLFHQRVGPVQANILNNSSQAFLVADLLLYPPIAVLIVDSMQAVVARIE
ncbi:MAG TPA: DnaJ domain-containing protein [Pyrinomonadaceae bacterium]|nr:DnaJ domain-containing protein [Pyrinomonadaceae bacterium]